MVPGAKRLDFDQDELEIVGERELELSERRAESLDRGAEGVLGEGVRGCAGPGVASRTVSPVSSTVSAEARSSGVPQLRQNLLPSGTSRPHFVQRNDIGFASLNRRY
jgi:hypothetical protein